MKRTRILLALLALILCTGVAAQSRRKAPVKKTTTQVQHLKFAGIPLNGTIANFERQFLAKGAKVNEQFTKTTKDAAHTVKVYDYDFMGKHNLVAIYYSVKTKTVYKAMACSDVYSAASDAANRYDYIVDAIKRKYPSATIDEGEKNDYPSVWFNITSGEKDLGVINICRGKGNDNGGQCILMYFTDTKNDAKNTAEVDSDL